MKQLVAAGLALACLLTLGGPPARAALITFDNISDSGSGTPIPNGYHGLNWTNFFVLNSSLYPASGYVNGVMSPTNVAFNGYGAPAILSSATPFDLNSGYFTAAWADGLSVRVTGYRNGGLVNDTTFTVNTSGPTFEDLEFLGVDTVVFSSSGGTNAGLNGGGTHFALDNLTINEGLVTQGLPEPASLALFGIGAAATGLYGWRRRGSLT